MTDPIKFRKRCIGDLMGHPGVYALCDLDENPIYVGQGIAARGIRQRVQRHLTSARSDMVANRGIDVWEIAYVWCWPINNPPESISELKVTATQLELDVYLDLSSRYKLLNFKEMSGLVTPEFRQKPAQKIQIIEQEELLQRRDPKNRMLRQIKHLSILADHMIYVKRSGELQQAFKTHLQRTNRLCEQVLEL